MVGQPDGNRTQWWASTPAPDSFVIHRRWRSRRGRLNRHRDIHVEGRGRIEGERLHKYGFHRVGLHAGTCGHTQLAWGKDALVRGMLPTFVKYFSPVYAKRGGASHPPW